MEVHFALKAERSVNGGHCPLVYYVSGHEKLSDETSASGEKRTFARCALGTQWLIEIGYRRSSIQLGGPP